MVIRSFLFSILLFATAMPLAARDEDDRFVSESHGFTVQRPDDTWTFNEVSSSSDGKLTLVVQPKNSIGVIQFAVEAVPLSGPAKAEEMLEQTLPLLRSSPQYTDVKRIKSRILGKEVQGICLDTESSGFELRLHLFYVVEKGMQYTLRYHAPAEQFDAKVPVFSDMLESFRFIAFSEEMKAEQDLLALAAKCGSEIEWIKTWEEASRRAKKEKKMIIVPVRSLGGFNISDPTRTGPLMDPDVVGIVQERFLAFDFKKGMDAPFVSQDSYGMSPTTFGTSVLLAAPDGEIVGDTCSIEPFSFHDFLLEHLAKHPRLDGPSSPGDQSGLDLAQWHLKRGDYEQAGKILEADTSARAHRLKADLQRRLRKGDAALAEIEKVRKERGTSPDLLLLEATVRLKMGGTEEAHALFTRVVEKHPDSDAAPEAMFWKGACAVRPEDKEAAEAMWTRIIQSHKDSRWAWRAAAALKSTAFAMGYFGRLNWPPEDVIAANRVPRPEVLTRSRLQEAEKSALEFLLSRQRSNGSWITPTETMSAVDDEPNEFTQAITAICGQSLLAYHERTEAAKAVDKAIDYLLRIREKEKEEEPEIYFMDYVFWKRTYVLWFFADCLKAGIDGAEKLKPAMAELVEHLRKVQKPGGGWNYLITQDLENPEAVPNISMSFTTASVLMALLDTRESGIAVPDKMIDDAVDCLKFALNDNKTFEYIVYHDLDDLPRRTPVAGAAGRGPVCSLAMYLGGKGDLDTIRQTLDLFMVHRHTYSKEQGKTLMHAGPEAQGSHYLMFDYAYAAEAIMKLPEEERAQYAYPLLDQILAARTIEGSYVDNPLLGWFYGTAMALLAFQQLGST